jgi:hypothetical protein
VPFLLAEQKREWSLMIFCARTTRGRGLPSPGLMARLGAPVGGRVKRLRAVGDHLARPQVKRPKNSECSMRAVKDSLGHSRLIVRYKVKR